MLHFEQTTQIIPQFQSLGDFNGISGFLGKYLSHQYNEDDLFQTLNDLDLVRYILRLILIKSDLKIRISRSVPGIRLFSYLKDDFQYLS